MPARPLHPEPVLIRRLSPDDSVVELTDLLHRAYARLADMGLRYLATHQTPDVTVRRIEGGECFVAVEGDLLVGTVTFHGPGTSRGCAWYERGDVATLNQFGVDPDRQGRGIGFALYEQVLERARATGARELALDTAKTAGHLLGMYERWGFRPVQEVQWPPTNYISVVLSKPLVGSPPQEV